MARPRVADADWLVRAGPLRGVPMLVGERGVDAAALLADCGLPSAGPRR